MTRETWSLPFGRLYAANTFGAIVGTIAAGFILIELLGLTGTLLVGAGCSATAGIGALILDRLRGRAPAGEGGAPAAAADPATAPAVALAALPRPRVRLALIVAFVSGLTSLGYQVLWTRLLASGTGDSTYVFTTILTIFLIGLALGAVAFNVFQARDPDRQSPRHGPDRHRAARSRRGCSGSSAMGASGPLSLTTNFQSLFT